MKYPFKTEPYDHQITALKKGWKKREFAYFMEMGTGKTKVTIDNTAMLYDEGQIEALLVVAPKGVYRNWSNKEIPEHLPDHISTKIGVWQSNKTIKFRKMINDLFLPTDDLVVLVINIDALITKDGAHVINTFLRTRKCMMVIDEATNIKNNSAKRTKAAIRMGKAAKYRRILTGSPVTNSPLDIYSQCAFLNEGILGYASYYGFRNHFAVVRDAYYGGRSFKEVVGYQNQEELAEILKEFSYRVTKDECLDLPEKVFQRREFDMSPEQKKVYKQMSEFALAFLEDTEATATIVITQLLRLHQISCGFFQPDEGDIQTFPHDRLNQLSETIDEATGKIIIWANYRHDIFAIKARLEKDHGAESVVTYFGDTSDDDRQLAVKSFQDTQNPVRFFVANTQTGGYGITLTEASTVIYYSNNYDLEKRIQSEDRAHRIGQMNRVTYIDLVCRDTVDEKIIKALRNKISLANVVTGDEWKEWI